MDLNKDLLHKNISNLHLNIDAGTVSILYQKYKSFILPIVVIVASIVLFFVFVMPQIQNLLNAKDQETIEKQKLEKLKANYSALLSMDQATLNTNFQTLTSALPSNKDFVGIINSISYNSAKSGVVIGDFQFAVGDISKPSDDTSAFPSIQIKLNVSGGPKAIQSFISALYNSSPLAEVITLGQGGNSASITVQFYYKAFPQGSLNDETSVIPLSTSDKSLIDKISSWDSSSFFLPSIFPSEIASSSSSLEATSSAKNNSSPF